LKQYEIKCPELIHNKDGGLMERYKKGVKCQKCGYFLKQKEITWAYLHGNILLPFHSGPSKNFI